MPVSSGDQSLRQIPPITEWRHPGQQDTIIAAFRAQVDSTPTGQLLLQPGQCLSLGRRIHGEAGQAHRVSAVVIAHLQ